MLGVTKLLTPQEKRDQLGAGVESHVELIAEAIQASHTMRVTMEVPSGMTAEAEKRLIQELKKKGWRLERMDDQREGAYYNITPL